MTNPPPRKRFQIHLSTAIVMMFVAGVLMWANTRAYVFYGTGNEPYADLYYGWPEIVASSFREEPSSVRVLYFRKLSGQWVVNIFTLIAILIAVYVLCEWLIRRHVAREGS